MNEKVELTVQATLERLHQRRDEMGDQGGFTLIELLIVIVILGILAAIVVFAVQNLSSTSAKASCQSDFKTVETGVEAYKAQMGNYPSGNGTTPAAGTAATAPNTDTDNGAGPGAIPNLLTAAIAPAGVNAAATTTAATIGNELFAVGNAADNISGTATVGPWLKDVPINSGHYQIWVTNDASGKVIVLNSAGKIVSSLGATSGTVTFTAADCGGIT